MNPILIKSKDTDACKGLMSTYNNSLQNFVLPTEQI